MNNLTEGNEYKVLFRFALPILIGNIFQQFYNVADSVIVGNLLGKENLAAVGFCFQISLIIVALSMGLTLGTGILVSRYLGAKNEAEIGPVINTGFMFSAVLSLAIAVPGILMSRSIVSWFNVPQDTAGYADIYLRILMIGAVPSFLYNTMTNILRGLGDSKSPVYFLIAAVLLNVVLDIWTIKDLHMGIAGAAYATIFSQYIAFAGSFLYMRFAYPKYRIRFRKSGFNLRILKDTLRIGVPSMMQQLFKCIGFLTLQGMVNSFGSACMAAYAAASKIDSFAQLPSLNLGQALSNFTAQNLGAKKEKRAKKGFKASLLMGLSIALLLTGIILPNPDLFIRLFTNDAQVLAIGRTYLMIVGLFYFMDAAMQMLNGILLGYEKPFVPMISTIVSLCLMQVPAALLLSATSLGSTGIWLATPFGWTGGVAIRLFYYRKYVANRGKMKTQARAREGWYQPLK